MLAPGIEPARPLRGRNTVRIEVEAVTKGPGGRALPQTSLTVESGRAVFVEAETAQRPTVLGLIATGRMKPDTGSVRLDGEADRRALRHRTALVDAPDVSEPHGDVRLGDVVAEELMFAGQRRGLLAVRRELDRLGLRDEERTIMADLAPGARVRALSELALLRPDVEALVIVSPDRHGGDPEEWWRIACEIAERGTAVLVIAGLAARAAIEAHPNGWGTGEVTPLRAEHAASIAAALAADEAGAAESAGAADPGAGAAGADENGTGADA